MGVRAGPPRVVVVGAGPAGLAAAQRLGEHGVRAAVYDRKPFPGLKLLLAGRGGLNVSHSEPAAAFQAKLDGGGSLAPAVQRCLERFGNADVPGWCADLGVSTFVGSSGRVYPDGMRARPLLDAWLGRLDALGVEVRTRTRWLGFSDDDHGGVGLVFRDESTGRTHTETCDAALLALGGASWPRMGSDGAWVDLLRDEGVPVAPLRPANVGFEAAWSDRFADLFEGAPVKDVRLRFGEHEARGDLMLTRYGIEGGAVCALSRHLRDALEAGGPGGATLFVDLKHAVAEDALARRFAAPAMKKQSTTSKLRRVKLSKPAAALVRECCPSASSPDTLASAVKALPIRLEAPRPIDRAISTAGGVELGGVDERSFELTARPGVFVAGECLDFEAPTGGYLITTALSTGFAAADGVLESLKATPRQDGV